MPIKMRPCNLLFLALSIALVAAVSDLQAQSLLWDTGAPQPFDVSGVYNYYGFSCGSQPSSDEPQLQVAAPFEITGGSATLTQINADWYDYGNPSSGGQYVTYTIWQRTGLSAPVNGDQVSSGTLGLYSTPGIDDPGISPANTVLHQYTGLNIPLPAGNYYLSISASGAGYDGVDSELDWLSGADSQPADLEWNGVWRSYTFPSPGFIAYSPTSITQGPFYINPLDAWNMSFALYGTPQYSTLVWLGAGSNTNWSTSANWGGTTPSSGAVIEFGPSATGGTANFNDLAPGTLFPGITFLPGAPAYQLSGNSISLGGNVVNLSSNNQTIGLALALVASGISFDTGAAGLSLSGNISGSGGITKLGSGQLILSGSNSYTGGTNVEAGTLIVTSDTALPEGSSLIVAAGGTLVLDSTAGAGPVVASPLTASADMVAVPEPGTLVLLIAGLVAGFAVWRTKRACHRV